MQPVSPHRWRALPTALLVIAALALGAVTARADDASRSPHAATDLVGDPLSGVGPRQRGRRPSHRPASRSPSPQQRLDLTASRAGVNSASGTTTAAPACSIQRALALWWSADAYG